METDFKCEQCGEMAKGIEYHDGYLTIEQHYQRPNCGYRRHWAYGRCLMIQIMRKRSKACEVIESGFWVDS